MSIEEWIDGNPEYKEKYEALTDEERKQLLDAVERVKNIVNSALSATVSVVQRMMEAVGKFLYSYPNKRVILLAVRSKKKRIRKKNLNRIKKDMQRWARKK